MIQFHIPFCNFIALGFFSFQLYNAQNILGHEPAILVRCFSKNGGPSTGKKDLILLDVLMFTFVFVNFFF